MVRDAEGVSSSRESFALSNDFGSLARWQNVDQKPPPSLRKSEALPCSRSPSAHENDGQSSARSLPSVARGTISDDYRNRTATAPPKPSGALTSFATHSLRSFAPPPFIRQESKALLSLGSLSLAETPETATHRTAAAPRRASRRQRARRDTPRGRFRRDSLLSHPSCSDPRPKYRRSGFA